MAIEVTPEEIIIIVNAESGNFLAGDVLSGVPEAPGDGQSYARRGLDATWQPAYDKTEADAAFDASGSAAAVQAELDAHEADLANPHAVTAAQAGADPAGSAAAVQTNLDTHEAAANPHSGSASLTDLGNHKAGGTGEHPKFTSDADGFVPSPGAGSGTRILQEDATWVEPSGGGGIPEAPNDGGSYVRRGSDSTWQPGHTEAEADAAYAPVGHVSDTANPHSVTKAQVGLSNVDNTSDADKPISTAQQAALDLKADQSALDTHTGDATIHFADALADGKLYARQDNAWTEVTGGGAGLDYWTEDGSGNLLPDAAGAQDVGSDTYYIRRLNIANGGYSNPSLRFPQSSMALYSGTATDCIGWTKSGTSGAPGQLSTSGVFLSSGGFYGIGTNTFSTSNQDTRLYRDDAGIFAQRNDTNPQEFRVYKTWGGAGIDYERISIGWSGDEAVIGTENGGTGTARDLVVSSASATLKLEGGRFTVGTASDDDFFIDMENGRLEMLEGAQAFNSGCIAIGANSYSQANYDVALGYNASAKGNWSPTSNNIALGANALANRTGAVGFVRTGNTQANYGLLSAKVQTTDASATAFTDFAGTANKLTVPADHTLGFRGVITAQKTDQTENATFIVEGCIKNDSGTTGLVGTPSITQYSDNSDAWSITISADDTNDCLKIELTAEATVNGTASLHFVEQASAAFTS